MVGGCSRLLTVRLRDLHNDEHFACVGDHPGSRLGHRSLSDSSQSPLGQVPRRADALRCCVLWPTTPGFAEHDDGYASIPDLLNRHPVTARQCAIAALAALALVIDGLDIQLLSLVSPLIIEEWSVSKTAFSPALAAALMGMSLGASVGGWLGDRYGRKRVLGRVDTRLWSGHGRCGGELERARDDCIACLLSGVGFGAARSEWRRVGGGVGCPRDCGPRVASLLSVGTPLGGVLGATAVIELLPQFGWRGCL